MIKKILQKLQVTRAVKWSLLTQGFRLISGLIITLLYIKYLDLKSLGYAYTFASVLGISIFLEMGFSQNIVQFVCHEFSKLKFSDHGTLEGDEDALSRVVSIGRLSFKYYSIASAILLFLLLTCGRYFLEGNHESSQKVIWQGAWVLASCVTCATLIMNPMWSIFEGCNRIGDTEKVKFIASVLGLVATFIGLYYGLGLYAVCFNNLAIVCVSLFYFLGVNGSFFRVFMKSPKGAEVSWRKDIWPLQWRIAISWISGYFIFSSITPIVFRISGPESAGRVGFSLQITRLIGSIASSWGATRIPEFGMCAAAKKWENLDHLWKQSAKIAISLAVVGNVFLVIFMHVVSVNFSELSDRYVGLIPLILFALSGVTHVTTNFISYYLRAFKKEPFALLSLLSGILTTLMIFVLTKKYNTSGTAFAYLTCNVFLLAFAYSIFRKNKKSYIEEFEMQNSENCC